MEQFPNVSQTYNIVILLYQKLFSLITDPDGQAVGEVSKNRQYCVCRRALQYASNLRQGLHSCRNVLRQVGIEVTEDDIDVA